MSESVTYRTMTRDDYSALINMVCNAWYNDNSCDWATAHRAAEIDFEYALARTTTAQVAVDNGGRVVGVILGRIDSQETRPRINRHHTSTVKLMAGLLASKEGRELAHRLRESARANAKMIKAAKDAGNAYDAEIVLFMVDPDMQGNGIGSHLFNWMLDEFRKAGVKNYFLLTDTTCDFSFYDHKGLNRAQEEPLDLRPHTNAEAQWEHTEDEALEEHLHAFMYDNEVEPANEGVNPLGRD